MRPVLAALLLCAACFPYRELYRPDLSGRVVDEVGQPVAGAEVTACSYSRWRRPSRGECPRAEHGATDADGGFHFAQLKEWEWCCFGEAPMPQTELRVCTADGGAAFVSDAHGWPKDQLVLRLSEGESRCAER